MTPLPSLPPKINFYPFVNGGILHIDKSHRIWALNSMAAFIWCILDKSSSQEEIGRHLAEAFEIDSTAALRHVKSSLSCFEREGLFTFNQQNAIVAHSDSWAITPTGPRLIEPTSWATRRLIRTPNHVFEICCSETILVNDFEEYMSHLILDHNSPCDTRLAILPGEIGTKTWDLFIDGLRFKEGLRENELYPHIATLIFVRACEALQDRLLFHAAVLEKGGTMIVFPGEAGSGKTTLAAALALNGFRFFSDEIAAFNVEDFSVSPLPLPMSIKPRSVRPLSQYYPGLAKSPVHLRSDGKRVRYLSPPPQSIEGIFDISATVSCFVFPQYKEGAENRLNEMDKFRAMQCLAKTGSSNRDITSRDVETMITLVEQNPCYEIVYSDLSTAVELLEDHVLKFSQRAI